MRGICWTTCALALSGVLAAGLAEAADAGAPSASSTVRATAAVTTAAAPARPTTPPAPTPAKKPPQLPKATTSAKPQGPAAKTAGKATRSADAATRRLVAGGPTVEDVALGADTPELRTLHAAERELFPPAQPASFAPWPSDLPSPLSATDDMPRVHASGLPPAPVPSSPPLAEGGKDLSWLSKLQLPDLPVRWDARVVRYLEFFKDDPRGRAMLSVWLRRSGKYREAIRRTLRRKGVPEDVVWLAMIESGFEQTARSPVGALGIWQFMPDTGRSYGLPQDRWADQRLNVQLATEAAADFLSDLHRRFGSWELALAAYNMGYGGVLSVVRRYNTNDFWALSRLEGALPWETTLYVPKIVAASIVARNLGVFGFADVAIDSPQETEEVNVPPGTALSVVATAAGCTTKEIEALNPELRASHTPPQASAAADYPVRVPAGRASTTSQNLARTRKDAPPLERYVVRFGESLEQIAVARNIPASRLIELNAVAPGEVVRGGTILLVPSRTESQMAKQAPAQPLDPAKASLRDSVVTVPADLFVYPDRRRVFYRVVVGDTLREISTTFHVSVDELRRWNDLDPTARLQEGMTLQVFAPADTDLSTTVVARESDVRVVSVGSDAFFAYLESQKGKKRLPIMCKMGDTLESIGRRNGVKVAMMERINRCGRNEPLKEGQTVYVYVPSTGPASTTASTPSGVSEARYPSLNPLLSRLVGAAPTPSGPLPSAPAPDLLPAL